MGRSLPGAVTRAAPRVRQLTHRTADSSVGKSSELLGDVCLFALCVAADIFAELINAGSGLPLPGFERTAFQVRKRHFGAICILKSIILSRQARDKHRESTQKVMAFSYRP